MSAERLAAEVVATVRAQAAGAIERLGAEAALAGIDGHAAAVVEELIGPHLRDEQRLQQAARGGFGGLAGGGAASGRATGGATDARDDLWPATAARLPRLEMLVATVAAAEADAAATLLARAERDRSALGARFGDGGDPGPLTAIALGLSDPHNGRQSVAALTFASGLRVICKPRPVAMEAGLAATIAWLRARTDLDLPPVPAVLERDGCGWCELVVPQPCADAAEVALHYRRLGALAGLLGALGATDCHAENFVARGPQPLLVDAETLLHPRMLASPRFTLLETEIVPSSVRGPAGQTIDYPGFDASAHARAAGADTATPTARTRDAATSGAAAAANLPLLDGRPQLLRDHRAAFDAGLADACQALLAVGDALADPAGEPFAALAGRPARVVLRPTSVYAALLAHLASAAALGSHDGGRERVERELARYRDPLLTPAAWAAVQRAELEALARGDVPYFLADTTTGDLRTADGAVLAHAAIEPVLPRLATVVRDFAEGQLRLLR